MVNIETCNVCVMDSTADGFVLNSEGQCNYCLSFIEKLKDHKRTNNTRSFNNLIAKIKKEGIGKKYDCIIGLSGGLDSSYLLYKAVQAGLHPLAVHLDNGWNSELAVINIENLVKKLNVDLYTHVIDWNVFKDLQKSFFKANVIDIELLTDHALIALNYQISSKYKIKNMLIGTNTSNEGMAMPVSWNYFKWDIKNIKAIHKQFGESKSLKTYPSMSPLRYSYYRFIKKINWVSLLDYMDYDKEASLLELEKAVGYRRYEKKHYESIFTRFYQGYILPKKFNVDKRKLHYSTLIMSGQMSRKEALADLQKSPYDEQILMQTDKNFVCKKLAMSESELDEYLNKCPKAHNNYSNMQLYLSVYRKLKSKFS